MADRNIEALAAPLYIGNGVNRFKFNTDGTPRLEGDAIVWKDMLGRIGSWSLDGSAGKADFDTTERLIILEPSGALATEADVVAVEFQLPHEMVAGSALKLHLHWRQPNATIAFSWKYRTQDNLAASTSAWSSAVNVSATGSANATPYTSGSINQITMLGDIATTGISISSIVQVKISRTDATSGNIYIYDLDCHYQADALGSATEYAK